MIIELNTVDLLQAAKVLPISKLPFGRVTQTRSFQSRVVKLTAGPPWVSGLLCHGQESPRSFAKGLGLSCPRASALGHGSAFVACKEMANTGDSDFGECIHRTRSPCPSVSSCALSQAGMPKPLFSEIPGMRDIPVERTIPTLQIGNGVARKQQWRGRSSDPPRHDG
jgi:hypothetical protein